jgi:hypothetical protein
MVAWVSDSPRSTAPPGTAQLSLSDRLMSSIWLVSLVTTMLTDGAMLLALGEGQQPERFVSQATSTGSDGEHSRDPRHHFTGVDLGQAAAAGCDSGIRVTYCGGR